MKSLFSLNCSSQFTESKIFLRRQDSLHDYRGSHHKGTLCSSPPRGKKSNTKCSFSFSADHTDVIWEEKRNIINLCQTKFRSVSCLMDSLCVLWNAADSYSNTQVFSLNFNFPKVAPGSSIRGILQTNGPVQLSTSLTRDHNSKYSPPNSWGVREEHSILPVRATPGAF